MSAHKGLIAGFVSAAVGFGLSFGLLSALGPSGEAKVNVPTALEPTNASTTQGPDASDAPSDALTGADTSTTTPETPDTTSAPDLQEAADTSAISQDATTPQDPDATAIQPPEQDDIPALGLPGMKIDVEDISSPYNRKTLFKHIAKKQDDLWDCVEEAKDKAKDDAKKSKDDDTKEFKFAGVIVLHWTIDSAGRVTRADAIESSFKKNDLEKCLVKELKDWKLASPGPKQFVGVKMRLTFGEP